MWWLSRNYLSRQFDAARLRRAIEAAERQTSGEVMVSVAPFFIGSVRRAGERAFGRLGVSRTRLRNGVLFFVVPGRRQFIVLGDEGIHAKVGQAFWDAVVAAVSDRFKTGDMTGGLVDGIEEVGRRLVEHFPYHLETDTNELPDAIDGLEQGRPRQ